jgi:hypothetical protein
VLEGADIPRSPAWWFKILAGQLQDRRHGRSGPKKWTRALVQSTRVRPGLDLLHDHLAGDPPLQGCAEGWKDGFREVVRLGRLNVAALAVESKLNRMDLRDFRTAAANDELGDAKAREIMLANDLPVKAADVHTGTLSLADGYAMVTPQGEKIPIITAEDARECITADDPLTGKTLAGLKLYRDEWDSADFGHLFIREDDGSVSHHVAIKRGGSAITTSRFYLSKAWEWDRDPEKVPKDRMPLHHFRNRGGVGEFERHLDTLDRINDQILNKLVIAKIQAFRQRAIKGLPETQKKLVDGKMTEVAIDYSDAFLAGPGELWRIPENADFWESAVTDMTPLLNSIKHDLIHFAAVTSTSLNIVTPDAAAGSAEGAALMREQQTFAVKACIRHVDREWAAVMADCFAFMGDKERSQVEQIEPIWDPIERFSLAERADAASKAATSLPREAIQRDIWQYAPAEIPNLRILEGRDFLTNGGGQPQPPAPAGGTGAGAQQPALFEMTTDGADTGAAG